MDSAPDLPRRIRLWKKQYVGIPLILMIPILAVTGRIGERDTRAVARAGDLEIVAVYPERMHYGTEEELTVELTNLSGRDMSNVEVEIDPGYLDAFARVVANLPLESEYRFRIPALPAGQKTSVTVSMEGDEYGTQQGKVSARAQGTEVASVELKSFVFP